MTEFNRPALRRDHLDDFFFSNASATGCIAVKGDKSWTRFRTEQLDDVSARLIIARQGGSTQSAVSS